MYLMFFIRCKFVFIKVFFSKYFNSINVYILIIFCIDLGNLVNVGYILMNSFYEMKFVDFILD